MALETIQQPDATAQQTEDATAAETRQIRGALGSPFGTPTALQRADYAAALDDLVQVSPPAATCKCKLPEISRSDLGGCVLVHTLPGAAGACWVHPASGNTLTGGAISASVAAGKTYAYVVVSATEWVELWR